MTGGNVVQLTAPISEYADMVLHPGHDSAEAVRKTLADPYRYAHCLDLRE